MAKAHETLWLQISAGQGPAECALGVAKLVGHLEKEAKKKGFQFEVLEAEAGNEKKTLNSALIRLSGEGVSAFSRVYEGSIKWVYPSPFRKGHKRKNWFIKLSVLQPLKVKDVNIAPRDLKVEVYRASGPGGQHVNTTDSAVRVTHLPTGLVTVSQAERSQIQNKKICLARLMNMLEQQNEMKKADQNRELWQEHKNLERGNAVLTFKGADFKKA